MMKILNEIVIAPCPFCTTIDTGGACCFCDYEGEVTIGKKGHFDSLNQYYMIYMENKGKSETA